MCDVDIFEVIIMITVVMFTINKSKQHYQKSEVNDDIIIV